MSSAVFALLIRSLRVDARSRGPHLARVCLLIAIYFAIIQVQSTVAFFGAPGLRLFGSLVWLNVTFLTLMGIGAFSSTITEEKEEDSLGLLQMAGISRWGLLLGKMSGPLMQALLLVAVQYPITLLSVTFGGVSHVQVQAAYIALTGYLLMLAGVGTFCSTVSHNSRSASRLMVLLLAVYFAIPWAISTWLTSPAAKGLTPIARSVLDGLQSMSVFTQISTALTTGRAESAWSLHAISNPLIGAIGLLLSSWLFEHCANRPRIEPISRGLLARRSGRWRWFSPGRPRTNALLWQGFHFSAGGVAGLLIRLSCYVALFVACWVLNQGSTMLSSYEWFCILMIYALPFDASLLVARALQDEVRGQTIPSLIMLPRSVASTVYSKLGGALIGLAPGVMCLVIAVIGSGILLEMVNSNGTGRSAIFYLWPTILLLPHLTAVISLTVRWGAVPLAIGALYALMMVEQVLLAMFFTWGLGFASAEPLLMVMGLVNLLLCVACHLETLRRFRKLAER